MSKIYQTAEAALEGVVFDGMTILSGGFGLSGNPENLIIALAASGIGKLTVISNNCGSEMVVDGCREGFGLWQLLANGQVAKVIASYVGSNKLLEQCHQSGEIALELVPQGTLAERIRAGGAGIPAFFTPTGVGTLMAEGKRVENFHGRDYLMERAIMGDIAIIKAWKGDSEGNLVFRKTARNFNPDMATAGRVTIAEVEKLVPTGSIDPDDVHTPGIFVDRIFQGQHYARIIEQVREAGSQGNRA